MIAFFDGYSAHFIYFLLFSLLFLCGLGFPFAEEPVLLAGGVLVATNVINPVWMFLSTFLGVVISDILLYWLGAGLVRYVGRAKVLNRWMSPGRLVRGKSFFARYGSMAICFVRFTPGLRAPTFLLAGTMHMGVGRFLIFDCLAACVYVPLVCGLGYVFADHIDLIVAWCQSIKRTMFSVIFLMAGLGMLFWYYRSKRERRMAANR